MGKTTTGLPYPEPTDPIAQGAAAIQGLAVAIGRQIQYGTVTVTGNNTAQMNPAITFPTAFTAAPTLLVGTNNWNWIAGSGTPTATGATLQVGRRDANVWTQTITLYWIAIGITP